MRTSSRITLTAAYLVPLSLLGCPVDDRALQGITVWVAGSAGESGSAGTTNEGGEAGIDSGGSAGASADGGSAPSGGSAGSDTGGGSANGGAAGSGVTAGSGGGIPLGGTGAGPGTGGACGCGGEGGKPRCPDIDGNRVLDCDETLAKNGSFDDDVSHWTNDTGVASSWRDSDSHDGENSGSMALEIQTVADQDGSVMLGTRQCFSADGGAVYYYGVEVSVAEGAEGFQAGIQLLVHDTPGCSGQPVSKADSNFVTGSAWNIAQLTFWTPPTAQSITLRLTTIKPFRAEPEKVRFDNVLVRTD